MFGMHVQRLLVRLIGALGALVLGLAGWLSGVTWLDVQPVSQPPPWAAVDANGRLVLYVQGQAQPLPGVGGVTVGSLPVLAPDGRRVALICEDAGVVVVRVVAIADGTAIDVYRDTGHVPQGVQWSPDAQYLAFRVDGGMETVVAVADGSHPAQTVARGAPAFFDWHPDSGHLLIHAGGEGRNGGVVALYSLATEQTTILHTDSGPFQAPQWNAVGDGYFYVRDPQSTVDRELAAPRAQVVEQYRDGRVTLIADEGDADIRLFANPVSADVAYIVATADSQRLVWWDGGARHVLSEEIPLLAFWAPDGRALAALVPVDMTQLQWVRIGAVTQQSERSAPFVPSPLFASVVQAGDVTTYTPWSTDAQWLLTPAEGRVMGIRVHGAPKVVSLGDGEFGMWLTAVEE